MDKRRTRWNQPSAKTAFAIIFICMASSEISRFLILKPGPCTKQALFENKVIISKDHQQDGNQSCRRTWPIWPIWHNVNESSRAIFSTNSCKLPYFPSTEAMTKCLRQRKIFLLGNSIARQYAFHVPLLLGREDDPPDRDSQMKACPKGFGAGGCAIDAPFNVTVQNFWFLYWNGKPTVPPQEHNLWSGWQDDNCGDYSVMDCLKKVVFQEFQSHESDILVTNIGIIYAKVDPDGIQDIGSWRKENVRAFILALDSVFNGTVVWMTQSKMSGSDTINMYTDARMQQLDMQIVPFVLEYTDWIIYDGYHINEPLAGNHDYFSDRIHHPGRLTHIGWQFILGYYCPQAPPVPTY